MNYRLITSGEIRIELTHDAATPGSGVYGTLKLARAHLAVWIALRLDELKAARKEWLHKAERDLPSDEAKIEQSSAPSASVVAQERPAADVDPTGQPAAGMLPNANAELNLVNDKRTQR